jgi:5-carboxymethyl-2-hydroxymuconate isomerase
MPHIIVEYTSNLQGALVVDSLLDALHASALSTGLFPIGGLRVRAHRLDHYKVADRHPDNGFVHVLLKIGHGRTQDAKKAACDQIFACLKHELRDLLEGRPFGLSMELQELDPVLNYKHNNLHDVVARRAQGSL